MKIKININTKGDAFQGEGGTEQARIIGEALAEYTRYGMGTGALGVFGNRGSVTFNLRDINGNTVGTFEASA
jgi:hypothetical protein